MYILFIPRLEICEFCQYGSRPNIISVFDSKVVIAEYNVVENSDILVTPSFTVQVRWCCPNVSNLSRCNKLV